MLKILLQFDFQCDGFDKTFSINEERYDQLVSILEAWGIQDLTKNSNKIYQKNNKIHERFENEGREE